MLPPDHDGTVILGKRKRGKSTLTTQLLEDEPRVILYDAKGDMEEPWRIPVFFEPELPRVGVFRGYVPTGNSPSEEVEWAAYLASKLGNCVFCVDEMADALEGGDAGPWVNWVTRMGRKRGVRYIYTYQRPQEAPRTLTSQASDWYLHQTNEPNELNYIKQAVSNKAAGMVRSLGRGESIHVKDGNVVALMKSRDPNAPVVNNSNVNTSMLTGKIFRHANGTLVKVVTTEGNKLHPIGLARWVESRQDFTKTASKWTTLEHLKTTYTAQ